MKMKKKHTALARTLIIVTIIAILSWLALMVLNQEISPDVAVNVDVGEIAQKLLNAIVDAIVSLINPERRSTWEMIP